MAEKGNKDNLLDDGDPNFLDEGFEDDLKDARKSEKRKNVYNKGDILDDISVGVSGETFEDSIRKDPEGYEKRRNAVWDNLPDSEAEKPSIWNDEEVSGLGLHDVDLSDSGYNTDDESNRGAAEHYVNAREIAENKASDDGFDRLAAERHRSAREIEKGSLSVVGVGSSVELEAALTGLVIAAATVTIHTEDLRSALSNGDRLDAANAKIADFENMYLNAAPSKDVGSQVVVEGNPRENVDMASGSEWTEIDLSGPSYMSNSSYEAEKTKPQKINESKSSRMLHPFRLVVSVVSTVITVFAIGIQKAARKVGSALAFRHRGSYDLKKTEDTIEYVMGDGADVRYEDYKKAEAGSQEAATKVGSTEINQMQDSEQLKEITGSVTKKTTGLVSAVRDSRMLKAITRSLSEETEDFVSGKSKKGMGIKELFSRHKKGNAEKSDSSENHKIIKSILKKTADLVPAGQDSELLKEFVGSLEGEAANLMSGKHESEEGMGIKELFSRYEEKDASRPDSTSSKEDSSKDHLADQGDQKVKGESGRHVTFAENREVATYKPKDPARKQGKPFTERISNDTDHGASR